MAKTPVPGKRKKKKSNNNAAMKMWKLFVLGCSVAVFQPGISSAQSERQVKSIDIAHRRAIIHTAVPLSAGILLMSLGDDVGFLLPGSLFSTYGVVVGPSMGNFYAGDFERGGKGVTIRLSALGITGVTALLSFQKGFSYALGGPEQDFTTETVVISLMALVVVGSMAYNIATIRESVREYNANQGFAAKISLAPSFDWSSKTPLVTARVQF